MPCGSRSAPREIVEVPVHLAVLQREAVGDDLAQRLGHHLDLRQHVLLFDHPPPHHGIAQARELLRLFGFPFPIEENPEASGEKKAA